MAITGKKINELESIVNPTLETVLPAVKIEGTTISDTATKITLQDIKTISQEGVVAQPNIQNLSGTNITINTLTANTIYQCETISSLTISNFENSYEESVVYFKTNSINFTLTFTIDPTWLNGNQPDLELDKNYILHLQNGIAWIQGSESNTEKEVIDLGEITSEIILSTNTNYTGTVSGSATFTLSTPTDTTVENIINILLTVSATTNIDWGVNVNSVLSSFEAGKYEIHLRYNNSTANWIGEVLKSQKVPSLTKCYIPFNGSSHSSDETENISIEPYGFTPAYGSSDKIEGQTAFDGVSALAIGSNYFTATDPNLVTKLEGEFTLTGWVRNGSSVRAFIVIENFSTHSSVSITGGSNGGFSLLVNNGSVLYATVDCSTKMHYFELTRDSSNNLRLYWDGVYKTKVSNYATTIDFSNISKMFQGGSGTTMYFQDFVLTHAQGHTSEVIDAETGLTYDVPTAPYVLADNSIEDYHDDTKQNDLTTIKGFNASATQTLKNINGVIQWVTD